MIFYDSLTNKEDYEEASTTSMITSAIILINLNFCPIFFCSILYRNRDNLDKKEIKEKIGTLYSGLKPKKPSVISHSFAFLLRRSLFVLITFSLFKQPGIQVQLMIYMTLIQLIYLGYAEFFETSGAKSLEILNETVFVLL